MLRFSANLGFLFTDRPLPEAVVAAARAGFDAVELHWPHVGPGAVPADELKSAAAEAGLPILALNTARGDVAAGDFGLSALAGREREARAAIDAALAYASACGAGAVHLMAGKADGPEAHAVFLANLRYALTSARPHGIRILLEPINTFDVPGYFVSTVDRALALIEETGGEAELLLDCYHVARMGGDPATAIAEAFPKIGHIQIAGVPDRGEPDQGTLAYPPLLDGLQRLGYTGHIGAEYRPRMSGAGGTEAGLAWLAAFRKGRGAG
ncbi:hydroxypyruvate isomerase family protein [Pannonibacter sp. SL95]|uniref:hydroxypyruvate isomerase family protein n=1 Tax=Pannonibacter sp. SL95 TaxID=2995153 RepID=UPI002272AFA2|nr:TIM barrel protein [Pannonibacter sp. SL95]MCY1705528.1 TIM barrel protein [Pannonibacter sp. SL95]